MASANPEGSTAADCAPMPCPDTPVSSDDASSSGSGSGDANVDCTIVAPPTCVEVPGDPGTGGGSGPDDGTAGEAASGTIACGTEPGGQGGAPPATACPDDPSIGSCPVHATTVETNTVTKQK
jgi:hypothetical protein